MDFDAVCRTCLNNCSSLKPIFGLPSDYKSFSKTIFIATGIKVTVNDGLPQKICGHCLEVVNNTIKFRKKCRKVDHTLRCIKNRVKGTISKENHIIENINSETDNEHSDTNDEVEIKHIDDETFDDDDDEPMKSVLEQNTVNKKTNECKTEANATLDVVKIERESNNDNKNDIDPNVPSNSGNLQHANYAKGFMCYKNRKKSEKINDTTADVTSNSDQTKQIPTESLEISQSDSGQNNLTTEILLDDDDTFSDNQLTATDFNSLYDADFSDPTGKRVKCKLCLKSLSIRSIDVHLSKSHPGSDPRRVKCKLCDCFVMKKRLLRHRLQVHGSLECRDVKKTSLKRKYCIFGCDKLDVHVHRFPHPMNHHEWYSSWVAVMGDRLQGDDPMYIYNNKRVCDYHFLPEDITAGRRVVFGAVPSLNLHGVFQSKYTVKGEHNYT